MNVVLSQDERNLGKWSFTEKANGLDYNNDIVITDKRFIYQKEHKGSNTQRSVSRFDVGIDNIKGINTFFGVNPPSNLWLVLVICGIVFFAFGLVTLISGEGAGGFMLATGVVLFVIGFVVRYCNKKGSLKGRKPKFTIQLETKTPVGSIYGIGFDNQIALRKKSPYNIFVLVLLTLCGVVPGLAYYFVKKNKNKDGIDIPEAVAVEVIETLGSLIF